MSENPLVILWADPERGHGRASRVALRRRGARVLAADSACRAIELAELFRPELLILEGRLDLAEGGDLASHFRSAFPAAEIMVLSPGPREEPSGVGLGLLYSGTGPIALETLFHLIETAFPGRLQSPDPARRGPATVLCVDDDPATLRSLDRLLTRHGYRVRSIADARRVMEAIPSIAPDLAILDVMMPGLDGLALAREIRREVRGPLPLVMLSARTSGDEIAAGYRGGADTYLAKPFRAERLLEVVDFYVGDLDPVEREALAPSMKPGWPAWNSEV